MEDKNWKVIWTKNYRGEGDTAELASYLKKLNYGNRTNISYLPWAVVERIFKFQDGTIEILPSKISETQTSIVEADRVLVREDVDANGVVSKFFANSYFLNIRANWQGQTYIERYPLQDSSGRALTTWTQNDINKAIQRGKVKAIAIVSGIGFKLFEDGDLQFSNEFDGDVAIEKLPDSYNEKIVNPYVEKPVPAKKEVKVEPIEKKEEKPVVKLKVEPTHNRVEQENEIKKAFLSGGIEKANLIKEFLTAANSKKMSDLSDLQIKELYELIRAAK